MCVLKLELSDYDCWLLSVPDAIQTMNGGILQTSGIWSLSLIYEIQTSQAFEHIIAVVFLWLQPQDIIDIQSLISMLPEYKSSLSCSSSFMRFFPLRSSRRQRTVFFALHSRAFEFLISFSRLSTLARASLSLVLRRVGDGGNA